MAAAIGAGLPVEEASGSMVVDIGGGTTEMPFCTQWSCIRSFPKSEDKLDESIISYVRRNQGVLLGDATAER